MSVSFPGRAQRRGRAAGGPHEDGDTVGRCPLDRGGGAAGDLGDLGVGQAGEVVVGDCLFLFVRQTIQRLEEIVIVVLLWFGRWFRNVISGQCLMCSGADDGDRLVVGDGHQPGFNIGIARKVRKSLQRGQKGLRPSIVSIDGTDDCAAYPQHCLAVLGDHCLEGLFDSHTRKTLGTRFL